jgi:cell division septal protein FtsQ
MNNDYSERQIDQELLKKKRGFLRKERIGYVFKRILKNLKYLFIIGLLVYVLFYSPLFVIREIEINNLSYTNKEAVLADFDVLKNRNFFLTDISELREKVIKKYPFVENVFTEKIFPSSVNVEVTEKEPFVLVTNDDGFYMLDREGFVLVEGEYEYLRLNYESIDIVGSDLNNIEFHENSPSNFYNVVKIHDVVNVLNHYNYGVKKLNVENQRLDVELQSDSVFVFSLLDDIDVQLKRLIVVLQKIRSENMDFETIDLRYERPVLK